MNRKQREANRETAANLKYSLMEWNSRNRKLVQPEPFVMVQKNRYWPGHGLIAAPVSKAAQYLKTGWHQKL